MRKGIISKTRLLWVCIGILAVVAMAVVCCLLYWSFGADENAEYVFPPEDLAIKQQARRLVDSYVSADLKSDSIKITKALRELNMCICLPDRRKTTCGCVTVKFALCSVGKYCVLISESVVARAQRELYVNFSEEWDVNKYEELYATLQLIDTIAMSVSEDIVLFEKVYLKDLQLEHGLNAILSVLTLLRVIQAKETYISIAGEPSEYLDADMEASVISSLEAPRNENRSVGLTFATGNPYQVHFARLFWSQLPVCSLSLLCQTPELVEYLSDVNWSNNFNLELKLTKDAQVTMEPLRMKCIDEDLVCSNLTIRMVGEDVTDDSVKWERKVRFLKEFLRPIPTKELTPRSLCTTLAIDYRLFLYAHDTHMPAWACGAVDELDLLEVPTNTVDIHTSPNFQPLSQGKFSFWVMKKFRMHGPRISSDDSIGRELKNGIPTTMAKEHFPWVRLPTPPSWFSSLFS
ncbi:hypothetical protein NEHOM01_1885 [Nematocida homosporus]|uniref:uncharacterized protein n=1 Tax=Nematocida homosporus TaxID=1912981 RepID=UPI00221E68DB|nr:uncharacterized protein NEHOM01_1885 [Nematocida homosporus]KAI5187040.1 hypothetical protein NEHOM01_1885 [Nematocida homosporus]